MAGYNVQTPSLFNVKDPISLIASDVAQLESQIITPVSATVDGDVNKTYSTEELLTCSIIRKGMTADREDAFPTATEIIEGMERKLLSIKSIPIAVKTGDQFPIMITNVNNNGAELTFDDSDGVNNDFNTVPANQARLGYAIVISRNPDLVYVDSL